MLDARHRHFVTTLPVLFAVGACASSSAVPRSSGDASGASAGVSSGAAPPGNSPAGTPDASTGVNAASSGDTGATGAPADGSLAGSSGAAAPLEAGPVADGSSAGASLSLFANYALPYQGTFAAPPTLTDTQETTDAPLLGNGDVGVAVLGSVDALTFILHKTEFWSLTDAHVAAMTRMSVSIPGMANASYAMSENIGTGEVTGSFRVGGSTVATKSWVQADDTTHNRFIVQFTLTGVAPQTVTVSFAPGHQNMNVSASGSTADVLYFDVRADAADTVGGHATHKVRVASRVVGAAGVAGGGQLTFTLMPGQTCSLVTGIMSNYDTPTYQDDAVASVSSMKPPDVDAENAAHRAWWNAFYGKSFIEIPDKTAEKEYYASLYLLASTSRTGEAPPGLWGDWVMTSPAWNGDYTLNYNYEVPFYASFPTNHIELADSYDQPVIDWIPNAQAEASANGWTGAYYRVHIGPLPNGSADTNEWNQKSCGAYAATDMILHYYYAPDAAYAAKIYPALKQLGIFWENYLVKDADRYDVVDDAQHEGNPYPQTNGIMSLGLVRLLLQACIDVSTALEVDATERATWQDRLTHLSEFPTFVRNGKTVFRYTEVGLDWNDGNSIGIQHIYPGGQIGFFSDPTLLQTAYNMVDEMARWSDDNGTNTFYPAAVRAGYDPATILSNLDSWIEGHTYPNLHIHTGGGGIENFNTVPSTLTEMLLQSFQGILRVFPGWPSAVDGRFGGLRAYGGFLVSSDMRSDDVQYVRIVSEQGGSVTLANPWPSKTLRAYRAGIDAGTMSGARIVLLTSPGETIDLAPDGTSYAQIKTLLSVPLAGDR